MVSFNEAVKKSEEALVQGKIPPLPVVRGITIESVDKQEETAGKALTATLGASWTVQPSGGLPGWWDAFPDAEIALGRAWELVYALREQEEVIAHAELLLLSSQPVNHASVANYPELSRFEAWAVPYRGETRQRLDTAAKSSTWHLEKLHVFSATASAETAWTLWKKKFDGQEPGAGIRVGHPDTGYTVHPFLDGRLMLPGQSFIEGENPASGLDQMDSSLRDQPGHGTNTSSVIVGRGPANQFMGVAPGARVLPLRVSTSVIHFDFFNVQRAIAAAVAAGADVISMSLGGPTHSRKLRRQIEAAMNQGVIVIAAAGNLVPTTVFPAAYPEMLAIGGSNALNLGWEGTSVGSEVDVSAPASDVWHAIPVQDAKDKTTKQGWGTSFAAAMTAGLAALWLSYHGNTTTPGEARKAVAAQLGGDLSLVPYAFALHLIQAASPPPLEWDTTRYGAGIPDAHKLLNTPLPSADAVHRYRDSLRQRKLTLLAVLSDLFTGGRRVRNLMEQEKAELERVGRKLLCDGDFALLEELVMLVASDYRLLTAFLRFEAGDSPYLLLRFLQKLYIPLVNGKPAPLVVSKALADQIQKCFVAEQKLLGRHYPGSLERPVPMETPRRRYLRVFATDPSLGTSLATAAINTVRIPILWEDSLKPGPIGEYLEVIDVDPASACVYAPVDLDDRYIIAQDGLNPSEGDPHFHQQMVYAVAMNTISHFERALGRPVFWSAISPWRDDLPEEQNRRTREDNSRDESENDRFVQRLRIYPHALREANAYYSPDKRALLFGYFPAVTVNTGDHLPGGMVFSCLSHDIIAHETTHALLDGMHTYFTEPSNPDVLAFHEAFSDIVALFQHFTYPDFLRHQIASSRGDLSAETLLGQLAQQFGMAIGGRQALRSALGEYRTYPDGSRVWEPRKPDPHALNHEEEPHYRGAILVAAVFRAFLILYNFRTADLMRLYTNGTGVLPPGQIHPDLVQRLADEASQTAAEILAVCIRALDYVPPVDITFGEYLRALITADYERDHADMRYRTAFIEAFRSWGIYPREVQTLSVESLRWRRLNDSTNRITDQPLNFLMSQFNRDDARRNRMRDLIRLIEQWKPGTPRDKIFRYSRYVQGGIKDVLRAIGQKGQEVIPGLDLSGNQSFNVSNLRVLRRILPDGSYQAQMIFEVIQTVKRGVDCAGNPVEDALWSYGLPFRGGATVIINLNATSSGAGDAGEVAYIIYKRLWRKDNIGNLVLSGRYSRQHRFISTGTPLALVSATTATNVATAVAYDMKTMFDSSCDCAKKKRGNKQGLHREQFAVLHRGIAQETDPPNATPETVNKEAHHA